MRFIDTFRTSAIARHTYRHVGSIVFFTALFAAAAVIPAGPERDIIVPAQESFAFSENPVKPIAFVSRTRALPSPIILTHEITTRRSNPDFRAALGFRASSSTSADDFLRLIAGSFSPFSFITVSGGDQTPKWGRAKAIPSVDVLDSKIDPFNPDATRERATGISANIATTEWLSFSVLALEGKHGLAGANPIIPEFLSDATLALRTNIAVGPTDLSFGGIRKIGSTGNEEPAVFTDFAWAFARGKVYGEWESEWLTAWKNAATVGLSFGIPWRLDRTITCAGEFRYQEKNDYSKSMIYAEVNGNELTDGFSVTVSALAAPDANEVVLSSGASQRIGDRVKVWTKYDYRFDWSNSEQNEENRTATPYGYAMRLGVSATL